MKSHIFNVQRFCTDDGDGIRTVIFFKGCPLRCLWCHNPESQSTSQQLSYNYVKCIGCGLCVSACKMNCHSIREGHIFDRKSCVLCGACANICPTEALEMTGGYYETAELVEKALQDAEFYGVCGGVTLSGGEPLMQAEAAIELFRELKKNNINTAVETCGFFDNRLCTELKDLVDTFLFDYKTEFDNYIDLTSVSGELIKKNLYELSKTNRIILRCPIIVGCNDTAGHLNGIINIAKECQIKEIHLLPYHNLGVSKAQNCGMKQEKFETPSKDLLNEWKLKIESSTKARVL